MSLLEPFAWSRVLVVDDDPGNGILTQKILERAGLKEVQVLLDPRRVLESVTDFDPDLVLLDLHMPHLDGYAVLTSIRRQASSTDLPVIVLTGDATRDASRQALGLGANDFLIKPLEAVELTHRVRNLLDMRAAHQALRRRQRWLEESERFAQELFSSQIDDPILNMVGRAQRLSGADFVAAVSATAWSGAAGQDRSCTYDAGAEGMPAIEIGPALREQLERTGMPLLVPHPGSVPGLRISGADPDEIGSAMMLPIRGSDTSRGVLFLFNHVDSKPFAAHDLDCAHDFLTRAANAVELMERRTEQKRYLDFFQILVSQVAEYAIVRLKVDGTVATWNTGAERVEGYRAEEVLGRHFSMFHPKDEIKAGVPAKLLSQAEEVGRVTHEGWGVRKDGSKYWGVISLTALHGERGDLIGYAMVTRDMTESRRLELGRESFFASLSHDIKAPLTAIEGFAEMLPNVGPENQAEFAYRIKRNVGRLGVMIDNVLDHARLRADAVTLSPKVVNASAVARSCAQDLDPVLGAHQINVESSPVSVTADPQALGRVLANLLVNAAKYSPDGTPIDVTFESTSDLGIIKVADQGRGIAEEDLSTIFDEFERGSMAESDGGSGLGLSSVRQLVALQHGHVSVESEAGVGTTFTIELPRAEDTNPLGG